MTEAEVLERLRGYFQTKVNNLNDDEMVEGPFEDENDAELGDTWQEAATIIDRAGGLKVRFELGKPEEDA